MGGGPDVAAKGGDAGEAETEGDNEATGTGGELASVRESDGSTCGGGGSIGAG
jgi:hypothetical protein